jgi:hypothetical protein
MTKEFKFPNRPSLLAGAMLVALLGMLAEQAQEARHFGYADLNKHQGCIRVKQAIAAVKCGQRYETSDVRILDLMARTQLTLGVSFDEWEQEQLIFPTEHIRPVYSCLTGLAAA